MWEVYKGRGTKVEAVCSMPGRRGQRTGQMPDKCRMQQNQEGVVDNSGQDGRRSHGSRASRPTWAVDGQRPQVLTQQILWQGRRT